MDENIIKICLLNKEFSVKSQESKEHVLTVANLVNDYLNKIQRNKPFGNKLNLALLAALNISSEYVKIKEEYENFEREVMHRVGRLVDQIDEYLKRYPCGVCD